MEQLTSMLKAFRKVLLKILENHLMFHRSVAQTYDMTLFFLLQIRKIKVCAPFLKCSPCFTTSIEQ